MVAFIQNLLYVRDMYATCMLRSINFPCDTGQLLKILEDEDITSDLSASNHQILQKMYSQASHVANQSMQHVERDDPKYFEQLKPLIDRPAILQKEYRRVDISLEWPPGTASYGGEIPLNLQLLVLLTILALKRLDGSNTDFHSSLYIAFNH